MKDIGINKKKILIFFTNLNPEIYMNKEIVTII